MIRQVTGKALLDDLQGKKQEAAQLSLHESLKLTLSPLLPPLKNIQQGLDTMLQSVISLHAMPMANSMTTEQAIFRCVFVEEGDDPVTARVDVLDERQKGPVFICTFPGVWRMTRDENQEIWVPIKRATAELRNAFD
jgi:hypothetical protein